MIWTCRASTCNCGETFESPDALLQHIAGPSSAKRRRGKLIRTATKAARTYAGVTYASKSEKVRAIELDILQQSGAVLLWVYQPTIRNLGCETNTYRPDFLVWGRRQAGDGFPMVWVEDVKGGYQTERFKRNRKIWARYGRCELHILTRSGDTWEVEHVPGGEDYGIRKFDNGICAGK